MMGIDLQHSPKKISEFFIKIKTISELLMDWTEIENLDEVTIFLAESIRNTVKNYEDSLKKQNKSNVS